MTFHDAARYPIITVHEAVAQESGPSLFYAIARRNEAEGKHGIGQRARQAGNELARMMGFRVGHANNNRQRANRRAA